MIVLGFDTATPATVVGLRLADGTALQARDDPPIDRSRGTLARDRTGQHPHLGQRPGHTTRLLALASELLTQAGLRWGELERIAVGLGPGTFTGLRIGVATARGLAQSLEVEVVGVSTLRVLAEAALRGSAPSAPAPAMNTSAPALSALAPAPSASTAASSAPALASSASAPDRTPPARVLAAIDARRGEAFAAAYAAEGELTPPRALAPEALAAIPARAGGDREWLAVGDGALRFRGYLEAIAVAVPAEDSPLHRVDAGVLCELALSAPAGDPEAVLPDYRRRPDAEIALKNAGNEK